MDRTELASAEIHANVDICSPETPALFLFLLGIKLKTVHKVKYTHVALVKRSSAFARGSAGRCAERLIWKKNSKANLD